MARNLKVFLSSPFLGADVAEAFWGDMEELYFTRRQAEGVWSAMLWYCLQLVGGATSLIKLAGIKLVANKVRGGASRSRKKIIIKERSTSHLIFWAAVAAVLVAASPLFPSPFIERLLLYSGILIIAVCLVAVIAWPVDRFIATVSSWVVSGLDVLIRRPVVNVLEFQRLSECLGSRASRDDLKSFLKGFYPHYQRTTRAQTIAEHCLLALRLSKEPVQLKLQHHDDSSTLTVVTFNHPGLAEKIVGALAESDMSIERFSLFVNSANVAVGSFHFKSNADHSPAKTQHFLRSLYACISGKPPGEHMPRIRLPLRPQGPRLAYFQTEVRFDDSGSRHSTCLEILARDREGLLYDIMCEIARSGCDIKTALVEREGSKATDFFYLTKHGEKLDAATQSHLEETLLRL